MPTFGGRGPPAGPKQKRNPCRGVEAPRSAGQWDIIAAELPVVFKTHPNSCVLSCGRRCHGAALCVQRNTQDLDLGSVHKTAAVRQHDVARLDSDTRRAGGAGTARVPVLVWSGNRHGAVPALLGRSSRAANIALCAATRSPEAGPTRRSMCKDSAMTHDGGASPDGAGWTAPTPPASKPPPAHCPHRRRTSRARRGARDTTAAPALRPRPSPSAPSAPLPPLPPPLPPPAAAAAPRAGGPTRAPPGRR